MSAELEPIRRFLEKSVDAAVILDRDRRILYYNRAYEAKCGLSGRQLGERVAEGARADRRVAGSASQVGNNVSRQTQASNINVSPHFW